MNLIINSRDAMPDGGRISVRAANRVARAHQVQGVEAGQYVVLTVSDTGCGISPELLEQVTEPFFTTKEVGKGTGLGLSMVYGFAKQSGGAFHIYSRVGEGTRAEIWLPRAAAEAVARSDEASGETWQAGTGRALRILLVDDHEGVRETTAALLRDLGHDVVEAADGPKLLALLDGEPGCCDLLVTDYAMPHVSGTELIRQARQLHPGLPAVIITGYADAQSISKRPDDVPVLAKPFTPEQLGAVVALAAGEAGSATTGDGSLVQAAE
jgi:CheY-like chemotaxis protein